MPPSFLYEQAREIPDLQGFGLTIPDEKELGKLGMNTILAVARGSRQPPRLIAMEYRGGARDTPPVVLVGKGITFDTSGVNIKAASDMDEIKFDMCGAASVFGSPCAAALMNLPLHAVAIIPVAENVDARCALSLNCRGLHSRSPAARPSRD
jgi:leucyl aminopeptidase